MKVDITNVDKETIAQHACGEEMMVTTGVVYTASVIIGNCEIKGEFRFDEDKILDEEFASAKIRSLFYTQPRRPIR